MSKYEFIGDLCESSLISHKSRLKGYDAKDIADLIYLNFLALQILKSEFDTYPFARDYARKTFQLNNFDQFRQGGTDLYVLIHTLFGKNNKDALEKLKNQKANEFFLKKLNYSKTDVRRWYSDLINNKSNPAQDSRFFLKLENGLQISTSDYKSIRRFASKWNDVENHAKQLAMTRLLFAFKSRARRSELLPVLEKLSKKKKYKIAGAKNPEKSKPGKGLLKKLAIGGAVAGAAAGVAGYNIYKAAKDVEQRRF